MKNNIFPHNTLLSGRPLLCEYWENWQGGIECEYSDRYWSASDLKILSRSLSEKFHRSGLQQGEIVAIVLANTAAFPATLLSLLELGANPLLLNAAAPQGQLDCILEEFSIKWVIHDFIEGISRVPSTAYKHITKIPFGAKMISVLQRPESITSPCFQLPTSGVILHPTSGTYGASKFCLRNQEVAIAEAVNFAKTIDIYEGIRIRVTTPLSHAYAYGFGLISSIVTGSVLALDASFNPKRLLRKERESPSKILAIVPPMAKALAQIDRLEQHRSMSRTVFYAGAPCDPVLIKTFEDTFQTSLFSIYGSTETGAISTNFSRHGKLPGVGMPLKNVHIEVRNSEKYRALEEGAGEIFVKSPSMMQCYINHLEQSGQIDFWPTGDIGLQTSGVIRINGRIKDIINLGGMKVDPAEVEKILLTHPFINDVVVYPGLRDDDSEFVQAALECNKENMDVEEFRHYCIGKLEAYKMPDKFHILAKIPRTPSGKCLKIQCPGFPASFIH